MNAKVMKLYHPYNIIGSFLWGKVYDRYGWLPLVCSNLLLVLGALLAVDVGYIAELHGFYFVYGFAIGLGDSCLMNLINSTIMSLYTQDTTPAFAVFRYYSYSPKPFQLSFTSIYLPILPLYICL